MRRVHKDLDRALNAAQKAGWTVEQVGKNVAVLTSPDPSVTFRLPLGSSVPDEVAKRLTEAVRRQAKREVHPALTHMEVQELPASDTRCSEHGLEFLTPEGLTAHIKKDHKVLEPEAEIAAPESNMDHERTTLVTMEEAKTEGIVIRPRRALIHHDAGTGMAGVYESPAVLEVLIDGEVVEYRCAKEGCAEADANPAKIAAHYSWHVRRGEVPPADPDKRVVIEQVNRADLPAPMVQRRGRQGVRDGLARAIYEALKANAMGRRTNSKYANILAQHIEEAGHILLTREEWSALSNPTVETAERIEGGGPYGEAEAEAVAILEQIKELVGAGRDEALDAEREAEIAMLTDALNEAQTRAAEAEGKWSTLRSMFKE